MIRTTSTRLAAFVSAAAAAASAGAHEGHGVPGTHWHATDVWGFVVVAVLFAGALAWWRGRS